MIVSLIVFFHNLLYTIAGVSLSFILLLFTINSLSLSSRKFVCINCGIVSTCCENFLLVISGPSINMLTSIERCASVDFSSKFSTKLFLKVLLKSKHLLLNWKMLLRFCQQCVFPGPEFSLLVLLRIVPHGFLHRCREILICQCKCFQVTSLRKQFHGFHFLLVSKINYFI